MLTSPHFQCGQNTLEGYHDLGAQVLVHVNGLRLRSSPGGSVQTLGDLFHNLGLMDANLQEML